MNGIVCRSVGLASHGGRRRETYRLAHEASGLIGYLCLEHVGPGAFGGIRRARYADEAAARLEVEALAGQMSDKLALAGLAQGGAKAVLIDHPALDRERAFDALAEIVARLDGAWVCGPDLGTDERDLDRIRARTRHCNDAHNRPGASTARGVHAAIRAAEDRLHDSPPSGKPVVVQGLGSVGSALARLLAADGSPVVGCDVDATRLAGLRREAAVDGGRLRLVHGDGIDESADSGALFSPCAGGAVLTTATLPRLAGRVVCGSANRQLAAGLGPRELVAHGVVWVPDVLVGAGAVIEGVLVHEGRAGEVDAALEAIGDRTADVLDESLRRGLTPLEIVRERIAR